MKVLVTGANGQLGHAVMLELARRGEEAVGTDLSELDITDREAVREFIRAGQFDAIVHAAAWTAVDLAETERERCYSVNVIGTKNIAEAAAEAGAKLAFISTDYVFGGDGSAPYETDAPTNPLNYYGKTKAEAEETVKKLTDKHFIVRSSWIFGLNGKNFVRTMLRLASERDEISVVDDQIGSPTYSADLAALICDMLCGDKYGLYHATNEGFFSWAEFAKKILEMNGIPDIIKPVASDSYPAAAKRPLNSRLSKKSLDMAGFKRLPSLDDALGRYFTELRAANLI
jgi:dTDP-4-dehydrorhamnose reductase